MAEGCRDAEREVKDMFARGDPVVSDIVVSAVAMQDPGRDVKGSVWIYCCVAFAEMRCCFVFLPTPT